MLNKSNKYTFICEIGLNIAYQGSFRYLVDRQNVSDSQTGFFSTINILSTVHSFSSNEVLGLLFVSVGISEDYFCEGGSSARVMHDLFHDSLNVSISFGEVQISKHGFVKSVMVVSFENALGITSSLVSNNSAHQISIKLIYNKIFNIFKY